MPPKGYKQFIDFAAGAYGYDAGILDKIAEFESGRNPSSINTSDINAQNGTPSKGMFQFIDPTFVSYSKEARKANPEAWKGIPTRSSDWRAQALTASWALKNGKEKAWTTYKRALPFATGNKPLTDLPSVLPNNTSSGMGDKQYAALNMVFKNRPNMLTLFELKKMKENNTPTQTTPTAASNKLMVDPKNPFRMIEKRFGLKRSSSDHDTPGVHTEGSFHYQKTPYGVRAYDYGDAKNNPVNLKKLGALLRNNYKQLGVNEFFYDPLGWYIDNGRLVKGSIGGHGDHVHLAF